MWQPSEISPAVVVKGVAAVAIGTVIAVSTFLKLRYWFTRRPLLQGGKNPGGMKPPIQTILEDPDAIEYEIKDLALPVMTGRMLKFFIWLSYTRFGRTYIVSRIVSRNGLDKLAGMYLPEKPTFYPTPAVPPIEEDFTQPNKDVIEKLVENEVQDEGQGFHFPTVADYARAYRSGVCTPTDVAEAVLMAIEDSNKTDPPLRAIIQTSHEVVLAMAEASTQRWKEGKTLSIIDGVPIAIKGEYRVEPYELLGGSSFIPQFCSGIPESVAVRKLKEAGGVIIGVANLQEFGTGTLGSNPNKNHLTARNPYNPQYYPGGSSSGSAVCVAAGLCPISLGSDGGGSIRIPSAVCGVVGIKPTNQFIDATGFMPLTCSVGAIGPQSSSVLDTAIALDIISREVEGDRKLLSLEGLGEARLDGLNVGIYWEFFQDADPEIVGKCKAAVGHLQALGANVISIKIPELEDIRIAHALTIMAEFASSLGKDIDDHFSEITPETHLSVLGSTQFSAVNYINAQRQRTRAIASLKYVFNEQKVDVILTPATACTPPRITKAACSHGIADGTSTARLMRFSALANLTGIPGLVIPVGYASTSGLPISLQIMGQWYQERTVLKVGWALEKTGAFPITKPQVFYDLIGSASGH